MGWREELSLSDINDDQEIEVSCRLCKKHRYYFARDLKNEGRMAGVFMDELQRVLRCMDKHCQGPQLVALMHDELNEPFQGGMP